jgi:riboflavin synthase
MFTGIIETTGKVISREQGRFWIEVPWKKEELHVGQSISVDGCCLTIVEINSNQQILFDLSPETLDRTIFGIKKAQDQVNLERSMKLGGSLDGHMVTGHIDTRGQVRSVEITDSAGSKKMWFDVPRSFNHWLMNKGSASVDGISLTVNDVDEKGFSVALIPHTLMVTTLGLRKKGDTVNLEFDLIAKYVERIVREQKSWALQP